MLRRPVRGAKPMEIIQPAERHLGRCREQSASVKNRGDRVNPYSFCRSTNFQIKFRPASTYVVGGSGSFELISTIIHKYIKKFCVSFHFLFFPFSFARSFFFSFFLSFFDCI